MAETKRKRYNYLATALKNERTTFDSHWRELGEYILPRRTRFTTSDNNKGDKRNQKIIDGTGTMAARTLSSGMMSGVTSPARPWFKLTHPNPAMAEVASVKTWLHNTTNTMSTVFLRSNLYNALPTFYDDLGTFATGAVHVEEDFEGDVVRFYPFAVGSYWISVNEKLKVDTFYREMQMTIRQLVEKFGERKADGKIDMSNFSESVKRAWEDGHYEEKVDVCHIIHPNPEWNPNGLLARSKRYSSCYWEKGGENTGTDEGKFLRESGHDRFPVLVGRWQKTGEDAYGTNCPGMVALGDIKALQTMHKRLAQAIEKGINPALAAPVEMKNLKISHVPGDVTYVPRGAAESVKPINEVRVDLSHLLGAIQDHQTRIQREYFEDLFLMLARSDRREITAREIDERHEEKLLALGPVLEQLNQDLLDPLIEITFEIMLKQGLVPPPPEELQGVNLKVEYVSIMAQAQKLIGLSGMDRLSAKAIELGSVDASVMDKFNSDQYMDEYANILSVPPGVVRTDEEVQAIRQSRQQAQAAQAQAEQMAATAKATKDLSGASMEGDTALTRLAQVAQAGNLIPQ